MKMPETVPLMARVKPETIEKLKKMESDLGVNIETVVAYYFALPW